MRIPSWLAILALTGLATAAFPQPPQSRADAPLLHERLRDESALVRSYAEQALWLLWSRLGNAEIDRLMARGTEAMQAGEHREAIRIFSDVIRAKPEFAEGWNRRATVYYLAGEFERSIADCQEVLKRNPRHFGALSGLGQIYSQLEEWRKALEWYRRALEVNPNMLGVEMNVRMIEEKLREPRRTL